MNGFDEGPTLLIYQELEKGGEKLEQMEYSPEIQALLEEIGEKQCQLLNLITIQ